MQINNKKLSLGPTTSNNLCKWLYNEFLNALTGKRCCFSSLARIQHIYCKTKSGHIHCMLPWPFCCNAHLCERFSSRISFCLNGKKIIPHSIHISTMHVNAEWIAIIWHARQSRRSLCHLLLKYGIKWTRLMFLNVCLRNALGPNEIHMQRTIQSRLYRETILILVVGRLSVRRLAEQIGFVSSKLLWCAQYHRLSALWILAYFIISPQIIRRLFCTKPLLVDRIRHLFHPLASLNGNSCVRTPFFTLFYFF